MLVWIQAARIKTLYASLSPVMVGVALAANQGSINVLVFICTLIAAVFIQVGTNLANDYYDYKNGVDNKNRLGPDRVTQKGLLQPNQVKNGMIFSFIIALIFGFYLSFVGGWPIVLIGIVSILSGVLYTGGSKPYGYIGLGDIFVFIFFGVIAVPGTYYLQTNLISIPSILCGLSCGALSTSLIVVNNLRDMDNTRMIGASYSISSADTWEHKVCNFAADTTGALGDDSNRSLIVEWWLDGGSNNTSGAMPTAWEARAVADSMAAGSLDLAGSTDNDHFITLNAATDPTGFRTVGFPDADGTVVYQDSTDTLTNKTLTTPTITTPVVNAGVQWLGHIKMSQS